MSQATRQALGEEGASGSGIVGTAGSCGAASAIYSATASVDNSRVRGNDNVLVSMHVCRYECLGLRPLSYGHVEHSAMSSVGDTGASKCDISDDVQAMGHSQGGMGLCFVS